VDISTGKQSAAGSEPSADHPKVSASNGKANSGLRGEQEASRKQATDPRIEVSDGRAWVNGFDLDAVATRALDLAGIGQGRREQRNPVVDWLADGFTPEQIFPAISKALRRASDDGQRMRSLKFADNWVRGQRPDFSPWDSGYHGPIPPKPKANGKASLLSSLPEWVTHEWINYALKRGQDPEVVYDRLCDEAADADLVFPPLPEQLDIWRKRWFATVEAERGGHKGVVTVGLDELAQQPWDGFNGAWVGHAD